MTAAQIREVLEEAKKIGSVRDVYFEGGEPFLFYPLLVEGVRLARDFGFGAGIVSNAYWSTNEEDAKLWLGPLSELGISDLGLSDDDLHFGDDPESPVRSAHEAAKALGIPVYSLCTDKPEIRRKTNSEDGDGAVEIGGNTRLRGRAAEKLTEGLPTRKNEEFTECSHEELVAPERVHIDSCGNVHVCQGISMGNCWKTPLSTLVREYDARKHPVCGPLVSGGPVRLVEEYSLELRGEHVDECHLCFAARLKLLDRFPEYLAPRQVYGLERD